MARAMVTAAAPWYHLQGNRFDFSNFSIWPLTTFPKGDNWQEVMQ